jgi:hypothetical protein
MKRIFFILLTTGLLTQHSTVKAQAVEDSLRYAESIWSMKKKAIVLHQMSLSESEKSSFWPVYESYSRATQYIEMEYIYLISLLAKYVSINNENKVESLSSRILKNDLQLAKARRQYFKKFTRALSPAQAGKFMQIDNTFRTMLRIEMQKETPSIDMLETTLYTMKQ